MKRLTHQLMRYMVYWLALIMIQIISVTSYAAITSANALIETTAFIIYFNEELKIYERVDSNSVEISIIAVSDISLVPDDEINIELGAQFIIYHDLKNLGNTPLTPTVTWKEPPSNQFSINNAKIYIDWNNSGIPEQNEQGYESGQPLPEMAIGQEYRLMFVGFSPDSAVDGNQAKVDITVNSVTPATFGSLTATDSVTDTINISSSSSLRVFEQANTAIAYPNSTITYALTIQETSGIDTLPTTIKINGNDEQKILLRVAIPKGTKFAFINGNADATVLYHLSNETDFQAYVTNTPDTDVTVDAIAFVWDQFYGGFVKSVGFAIKTGPVVPDYIYSQAETYERLKGKEVKTLSNNVALPAPVDNNYVAFYKDDTYSSVLTTSQGESLYHIGVAAPRCNLQPGIIESHLITVSSKVTGDTVTSLSVTETDINSGFFTLSLPGLLFPDNRVINGDGVLSYAEPDHVTVSVNCGGVTITDSLNIIAAESLRYVWTMGYIFDSRSQGTVVPNAVVELYRTPTLTRAAATPELVESVTADNHGFYRIGYLIGNDINNYTYSLKARAPLYSFPSRFSSSIFSERVAHYDISYGQSFELLSQATNNVIKADIPLDPSHQQTLFITKEANKQAVEYGHMVKYTIQYKNTSSAIAYSKATLIDKLPQGFAYVSGSAKWSGQNNTKSFSDITLKDPTGAPGPNLVFQLGNIGASETGTLTYIVKVKNSAPVGDAINHAQLSALEGVSNTASAKVRVEAGVFSDEAFVSGMVYADCNNNLLKDADEPGIPFVRLYMEDGTFVITDAEGRYSLYGLTPKTHVLKVDNTTLPKGSTLKVLNNRFAKNPASAFVDVKKGELHRADFAIEQCDASVQQEIAKRKGEWRNEEVAQQLVGISDNPRTVLDGITVTDPKSRPSQGYVTSTGLIEPNQQQLLNPLAESNNTITSPLLPPASVMTDETVAPVKEKSKPLNTLMEDERMTNRLGFIGLSDNQVMIGQQITVRVKGKLGSVLQLSVNGQVISQERVGQKSKVSTRSLEAWEYIGVPLEVGGNTLEVVALDPVGNPRERESIVVIAPGKAHQLEVIVQGDGVADGMTPLPVKVRLLDKNGVQISGRSMVTLEASSGRWDVADLNLIDQGVQAFIEGGEATFNLLSNEVKNVNLRITSGVLQESLKINFRADLRPMIAVGIIDGAIGLRKLDKDHVQGVTNKDNFEESIRSLVGDEDKAGSVNGRAAMFIKGKVKGDYLLTLAYDSDKDTHEKMFRDIDPNKFYPVYGDDSVRGFDAQSSGPLYVRIDKGQSYILYGDYNIDEQVNLNPETVPSRALGRYSRNVTGLKGEYTDDTYHLTYFTAYTSNQQKVITIPGKGLSGPYDVDMEDYIHNSEEIVIVTRSREQPALILSEVKLSRFTDYTLDVFGHSLMFVRPIPSIDEYNNPVEIRITYEVENGGKKSWLYGGDGELKLTDTLTLGAGYLEDRNEADRYTLKSVRAINQFSKDHAVVLEAAESDDMEKGKGKAYRAEWAMRIAEVEAKLRAQRIGEGFRNAPSGVQSGRDDVSAQVAWKANPETILSADGVYSKELHSGNTRTGGMLAVERALTPTLAAKLGLRHVREKGEVRAEAGRNIDAYDENITSVLARLTWAPQAVPNLRAFVEGEQSLSGKRREMAALGSEYALSNRISLYGRHELITRDDRSGSDAISGNYGLLGNNDRHTTKFGVKYNVDATTNLYSEYRVANGNRNKESEAALGINNGWLLSPGLVFNTTFENVESFSGGKGRSTAATAALDYSALEDLKTSTRVEWRGSDNQDSWLGAIGAAYKLDRDWTALASTIYAYEKNKNGESDRRRNDSRAGLAYRDTATNRLHVLGRYQFRTDNDLDRTTVHILAGLANYQYNPDLIVSGRYGVKYSKEHLDSFNNNVVSQLMMGRFTYDLTSNWDMGCMSSVLFGDGSSQQAYGCEAGYLFAENVWLSVGYNLVGFYDRDLTGSDYTEQGAFLRMRIKFDESALSWLSE